MDASNEEAGSDKENSVGVLTDGGEAEAGEDDVVLSTVDGERYESDNSGDSLVWKGRSLEIGLVFWTCVIPLRAPGGGVLLFN